METTKHNHRQEKDPVGPTVMLDEISIGQVLALGRQQLEKVKPAISRKMHNALEEKLSGQERELKKILAWQQGRQEHLAQYSLILDPRYFEQEFM